MDSLAAYQPVHCDTREIAVSWPARVTALQKASYAMSFEVSSRRYLL